MSFCFSLLLQKNRLSSVNYSINIQINLKVPVSSIFLH